MEVDFDKEIDALLRQDGRGRTITISEFSAPHLDADDLSAFAENALPPATRTLYMSHLADCDHCRSTLSALVMLNAEAEPVSAVSPVGVLAQAVEKSIPWYKSLFAIQNLAYGMGGLVILFAGFIGYTLLNSSGGDVAMAPSPTANKPVTTSGPMAEDSDGQFLTAANSAGNSNASTATIAANRSVLGEAPATESTPSATPQGDPSLDGKELARAPMAAPPPPPPAVAAAPATVPKDDDARPADVMRSEDREAAKLSQVEEKIIARQQQIPSAGNVVDSQAGPARNTQRDDRTASGRMAARKRAAAPPSEAASKTVGGKTFSKRDGVWYDSAYAGQATTNIRRNTDSYLGLDRGLRTIAESLDGTLVVVWNSKAYRIQ